MAEAPLTFSVIVTSYNQKSSVQRLLGQLLDQDFDPSGYEIIVVDDGSADGSAEWLQAQTDPRVRPLILETNRGRAITRNFGIRAASGHVVVMIDGDHTIERDHLSLHAEGHTRERCVIVGKSDYEHHPDFVALNDYLDGCGASKLPLNARLPGRYFQSGNASVPRDLLSAVGSFDESFSGWGGEDLDLGIRFEKSGVPIYSDPRARAVHHHLRSLNELLANKRAFGRDGIPLLLSRHPQLFRELNFEKAFFVAGDKRCGGVIQFLMRFVLAAPFYYSVRAFANLFRRHRLPRAVFDYLHFRQYVYGYLDYLKALERK